jgi:predicted  nucleic acid-binding Zn-ribbon protein
MPGPAAILREIHRLRRFADELRIEIERGPRTIQLQQAKITKQEDLLREAQETIKRLKVDTLSKESMLRTRHQQIDKHQLQLNQASSKKEYDALKAEIAADQRACRQIEDDILHDMGETEEQTSQLAELERNVQRAKEEVAQFEASFRMRQGSLTEQLNQTLRQLKEVVDTLGDDVRPQFERLIAAHGEDALSAVQNRTCSACYTEITAQNYNDLIRQQFVLCKNCGRMLYLPE